MDKNISFTLKVWRQRGPKAKGAFETYQMKDIPGDTSFLEMLDILNEQLVNENKEPIVFDHAGKRHTSLLSEERPLIDSHPDNIFRLCRSAALECA